MKTLKEMVLSGELVYRFHVGGIGEPFYFCYWREIGGKENGKHSMSQFNSHAVEADLIAFKVSQTFRVTIQIKEFNYFRLA